MNMKQKMIENVKVLKNAKILDYNIDRNCEGLFLIKRHNKRAIVRVMPGCSLALPWCLGIIYEGHPNFNNYLDWIET